MLSVVASLQFLAVAFAVPLAKRQSPTYVIDGDAPFSVNADTLSAALTCPHGNPSADAPPVLLVHGTGTTGEQSWGGGYVPALWANGYTPCYVTLPSRAMDDMQVSSEYVAYSLHYLSTTKVSPYEQGTDSSQALQFWPSTRSVTRAFIALAPDFDGVDLVISDLAKICDLINCQPSLWQQSEGSDYYKALHAGDFRAQVPTTSIWSKADGVVTPPEKNAALPGAKVVSVTDLCPLRPVNHVWMTTDSAAFALALDALDNDGTASLTRLLPRVLSICTKLQADNMDDGMGDDLAAVFKNFLDGFILSKPRVSEEPSVKAYAAN
ncbi:hypothetical protein Q7P37_000070 [Cladosporium fusiforme]